MTGGVAAFWGALIMGPRKGRYDENKRVVPMPGHSTVLSVLGTFILWLGWYGFNPGSTLALTGSGYAQTMARVIVTTTLAAAAGGLTVVLLDKFLASHTWDVSMVCNGVLAGLVSITAGCSVITPWYSFTVGILGGFVYFGASKLMVHKLRVDDPLDAFAVHGCCGFWGVFATGLFGDPHYTRGYYAWTDYASSDYTGLFFGGGKVLGCAVVTLVSIISWVSFWAAIMFLALKFAGVLRVPAEIEDAGMDVSKHGGSAYNDMNTQLKQETK
uniref:Ammonium transporter AmtB-like domain-containing protein n=3 Tax=Chrysotila carterae TaxID=13221 RepID=A0A7S4EW55_CHRCT